MLTSEQYAPPRGAMPPRHPLGTSKGQPAASSTRAGSGRLQRLPASWQQQQQQQRRPATADGSLEGAGGGPEEGADGVVEGIVVAKGRLVSSARRGRPSWLQNRSDGTSPRQRDTVNHAPVTSPGEVSPVPRPQVQAWSVRRDGLRSSASSRMYPRGPPSAGPKHAVVGGSGQRPATSGSVPLTAWQPLLYHQQQDSSGLAQGASQEAWSGKPGRYTTPAASRSEQQQHDEGAPRSACSACTRNATCTCVHVVR